MSEMLVFDDVDLGYGGRCVLRRLNLTLSRGDFLGIVGPNGCGKTTILKAMLGILRPMRGSVTRKPGLRFGYVPQIQEADDVYPFTALEVALMGRYALMGAIARPSREDRRLVLECLHRLGIGDLADKPFRDLSGGQRQRTLLARSLASEPDVLVLDEPTNDMDIASEHAIMESLGSLHADGGLTIVIVSHLLNVVANHVRTLALINCGLRAIGPVDEVMSDANLTMVYGVPVSVVLHDGKRIVLAGGGRDA
jgi:ABC-type Mn2+/Zn2+ transport system ATPase subunit